ncbi:hypothetical protein [Pseudarthrobacter sp. MM222]|uniref:hypothetical protein n=1 Tax=Pseudarthrobacter sp. MM222 TaxID=3018929 RepID=UPI00221F59B9|nr:hypothetical protein [Pseudarthrobacter sp. MM222]CAI3792068.1 hypothetical protein NKCBBBOE_00454 [Pseudarthrobacter sp. MM222]
MNIVEFLEALIADQEAGIQGRNFIADHNADTAVSDDMAVPPSFTDALLAECAQKRKAPGGVGLETHLSF